MYNNDGYFIVGLSNLHFNVIVTDDISMVVVNAALPVKNHISHFCGLLCCYF